MPKKIIIDEEIKELEDFNGSLEKLSEIVNAAILKYGPQTNIRFDAGANNVSVIVDKKNIK